MTVNAQNMAEPRPVEVGDWSGEEWIIASGLSPVIASSWTAS